MQFVAVLMHQYNWSARDGLHERRLRNLIQTQLLNVTLLFLLSYSTDGSGNLTGSVTGGEQNIFFAIFFVLQM